jgi:O-antigen/teichoic acid export membrane protein
VWALVAGMLTSSFVTLAMSHAWLATRRGRWQLERESVRAIISFGKWVFLGTLLYFLASQSDRLLIGRIASIEVLGVYTIAATLALLPLEVVDRINGGVVFPAYSKVLRDGTPFATAFRRVREPIVLAGMAGLTLVAIASPLIIDVLYDARYQDAAWMMQLVLIGGAIRLLECTNGAAVLAHGDTRIMAASHAAKLAAIPVFMVAGYAAFGLAGAIAGFALSEAARYVVSVIALRRRHLNAWPWDLRVLATGVLSVLAALGLQAWMVGRGIGAGSATLLVVMPTAILWLVILARAPAVRELITTRWLATSS